MRQILLNYFLIGYLLLAYELYLKNKDSTANVVKQQRPIKKIFTNKRKITVDNKTIDEYGSEPVGKFRILQESLAMPLNTSDTTLLNLPDSRTSSSQPNPYVEIYGTLKVTNMKPTLLLQIKGRSRSDREKRDVSGASYNISDDSILIQAKHDIQLKLDRKNYFIRTRIETFNRTTKEVPL